MATTKTKSKTAEYAKKKKKPTTSKSLPGNGMAKKVGKQIEARRKLLQSI